MSVVALGHEGDRVALAVVAEADVARSRRSASRARRSRRHVLPLGDDQLGVLAVALVLALLPRLRPVGQLVVPEGQLAVGELDAVSSRKVPSVAFSPAPLCENGWMWMTPSPWVWMPVVALELGNVGLPLAADVDAEGGVPVVADDRGDVGVALALVGCEPDQRRCRAARSRRSPPGNSEVALAAGGGAAASGAGRPGDLLGGGCLTHKRSKLPARHPRSWNRPPARRRAPSSSNSSS